MIGNTAKRNPASRLREILEIAKKKAGANSARDVWCDVFSIPDPDSEEALFEVQSRLVSMRKLFADTEAALLAIPNINKDLFVDHISRLGHVININNLHDQWYSFLRHLSDQDMFALQYSEDILRQNLDTQENEIPPDEIQEILAELNNLYEAIFASSLPADLKSALLNLIQEMLRGVHEYRVRGAIALRDSLASSIGIIAANKQSIEENKNSDEIQALVRMLTRIDKAYSFAMKVQPLIGAAANIFPALAAHIK